MFAKVLLFLLLSLSLSLPATARTLSNAQVVSKIRSMITLKSIESGYNEVAYFKKTGFIYQPELSVPALTTCPVREKWDQAAVLCGLMDADRNFAAMFGSLSDEKKEAKNLQKLLDCLPGQYTVPLYGASFQKKLATPAGRQELARTDLKLYSQLFDVASKDEHHLRFVAGYLYGDFLERLYLSSIMVLAANEAGTLGNYRVDVDLDDSLTKTLLLLAREGLVGDPKFAAEREKRIAKLNTLISANGNRPSIQALMTVFQMCQKERSRYVRF